MPITSAKISTIALRVHHIDETSIAAENPLRTGYNAPDSKQIFRINHHLCQLMEQQYRIQILCNQQKILVFADDCGIPTDVAGICCIL